MGSIEYQTSRHTIDGAHISVSKLAPTNGEPYTRSLIVSTSSEDVMQLHFTHEGFELLKAIINEY